MQRRIGLRQDTNRYKDNWEKEYGWSTKSKDFGGEGQDLVLTMPEIDISLYFYCLESSEKHTMRNGKEV